MTTHSTNVDRADWTWTLEETAAACGLSAQGLRNWINAGLMIPAVPGGRGPGNANRFSAQQLYALAAVGALVFSERGCSMVYAKAVVEWFEGVDERTLHEWDWHRTYDYTEGAAAKMSATPELFTLFGDCGGPSLPSDEATVADIFRRYERIDAAIARRQEQLERREAAATKGGRVSGVER